MRNLLNPRWLLIVGVLPVILLFLLLRGEYAVFHSLLTAESIHLWKSFALVLILLGAANLAYAVFLIVKRKEVSVLYALLAMVAFIAYIYSYFYHIDKLFPFSIPRWMLPDRVYTYVGTFLMPTLAYCMLLLVYRLTSGRKNAKAWVNFLTALLVPLLWYLLFQGIIPLWKPVSSRFGMHLFLVLMIMGVLLFLFFLVRGLYILINRKWSKKNEGYRLLWKIPVALVFPLLGLLLNSGVIIDGVGEKSAGVFGNFSSYWFYVLALLNGIAVCLPELSNRTYRLALFVARSIMFPFTLYFFLVFLPYLPLSIVAIILLGLGFLMLTPILLLVVHINLLVADYRFLVSEFSPRSIRLAAVAAYLVLPLALTFSYLHDRVVLNSALEYCYSPDYSRSYRIGTASLESTLEAIRRNKNATPGNLMQKQIPFLSRYYNWLVLDNLMLSESKICRLEQVFFGKPGWGKSSGNIPDWKFELTDISTTSSYDSTRGCWISRVELELTRIDSLTWVAGYTSSFDLPQGCWISDYNLVVNGKREKGILAEKKSALWIFSNIVSTRRDPGILFYRSGNRVVLDVFPFSKGEVRKTGFELIHKEPVAITIDGHTVALGSANIGDPQAVEAGGAVYLPAKVKSSLKRLKRKPYFHFIIDASMGNRERIDGYIARIDRMVADYPELASEAKVSFVGTYTTTLPMATNWKDKLAEQPFTGGFFLDWSLRKILTEAYYEQSETFPLIVVITDDFDEAITGENMADYRMAIPETDCFLVSQSDSAFTVHSLGEDLLRPVGKIFNPDSIPAVLKYSVGENRAVYLPDDGKPSVILKMHQDGIPADANFPRKSWMAALTMQGIWQSMVFHPDKADALWPELVRYSFRSGIMSPVTSFLVVENEAQKAALKRKQEQVLAGNHHLDAGEEIMQMSEPDSLLIALLLIMAIVAIKRFSR